MKRIRKFFSLRNPVFFILIIAAGGMAQNSLVSVKKGNREDKSWAVFTFSKNAVLLGVSQTDMGKLSLYLLGDSELLNGSVITLDQAYDRSILIKQVHAAIIRADVLNNAMEPISILKKNGFVVVAFNDDRLLDGSTLLYMESASPTGQLVGLNPVYENDKTTATIQINGNFDWIGYVRSVPDKANLLICGVDLFMEQDSYSFEQPPLRSVNFASIQGEVSGIRSEILMIPNTQLNIVRKPGELVIQATPSQVESESAVPEPQMAISDAVSPFVRQSPAPVPSNQTTEFKSGSPQPLETGSMKTPVVQETTESIPWNRLVSFEFRSTPIRDALQTIAATNNLNMVITQGVTGSITMKLDNVTLRQALDKIINTQNCEYTVDASIITVKQVKVEYAGGRITKVYKLNYADAANVAKVIKRIASNDSLVEVFRPEFLDFTEAGKNRMQFSSQLVQGIRRSSVLVVTDRPEKIQEIDAVIRELDRSPVQIFIESKLVEMAPTSNDQLGIEWDKTFQMAYNAVPGGDKSFDLLNNGGFQIGREWQTGHLTKNQYASLLNFLQEKTDSKLILNPRIVAMDNEESIISIGQTAPIAQIQRGSGGQQDIVTFTYREVSIRLNVTPHVIANDEVTMYINPVIEEITDWRQLYGSEAPVTDKRSVNSIVTVRNGETVVIGGLIKNQRTRTIKKVWLLGNLPLFGRLFQYEAEEEKQTDLMIFITPTIVES